MRRIQLFEIHDQAWFPAFLRDQVTDDLQVLLNIGRPYRDILTQLRKGIERAGEDRVLDLCSGAGGPWPWLAQALEWLEGMRIRVELSDKYPNAEARARLQGNSTNLHYCEESVDAMRVPPGLPGFRTLFTSFHHFRPAQAREILSDAVTNRRGIGVFEIPGRRPLTLLLLPLVLIADIVVVPFLQPRPLARLVWRWLVPIVPLVLFFDGIISCLRAYSPRELREVIGGLGDSCYRWEIGCAKRSFLRLPITYLVGYPERSAAMSAYEESKSRNRDLLRHLAE